MKNKVLLSLATLVSVVALLCATAFPVFAVGLTPSVQGEPAPNVVLQQGPDGQQHGAIVYGANGQMLEGISANDIAVVPLSGADSASSTVAAALRSAYQQLTEASSLTELAPGLAEAMAAYSPSLQASDLVIGDLFDVTLSDTALELLKQEGASVSIRFQIGQQASSLVAALHNVSGDNWETIAGDNLKVNGDGSVDVSFTSFSPVAFVFDAGQLSTVPGAPTSPQTGETSGLSVALPVAGAAVAAGIGACVLVRKLRK